jgi:hypothetical protein
MTSRTKPGCLHGPRPVARSLADCPPQAEATEASSLPDARTACIALLQVSNTAENAYELQTHTHTHTVPKCCDIPTVVKPFTVHGRCHRGGGGGAYCAHLYVRCTSKMEAVRWPEMP